MAIRDEIRRERKKFLATATPKEKWNYFCDYYGLLTIAIIVITFLVSWVVVDMVTAPEVVLIGTFINLSAEKAYEADELGENFLTEQKIDTKEYGVSFGTGLTLINGDISASSESSQAMMTQAAGGALDFIAGPSNSLLDYAYCGLFEDLSTVISEDELELYKPYLHYIDEAVVELRQEREDNMESSDDIEIPDSQKPEEMERPIPIFISMDGNKKMSTVYGNTRGLILGVSVNAPNPEIVQKFIAYLMK